MAFLIPTGILLIIIAISSPIVFIYGKMDITNIVNARTIADQITKFLLFRFSSFEYRFLFIPISIVIHKY